MSNNKVKITLKTPLLNDCTNHLDFLLEQSSLKKQCSNQKVNALYESALTDVVTDEFIRGYN